MRIKFYPQAAFILGYIKASCVRSKQREFLRKVKGRGVGFAREVYRLAKTVEWQLAWLSDNKLCTHTSHLASEQGNSPTSNKALVQPYL